MLGKFAWLRGYDPARLKTCSCVTEGSKSFVWILQAIVRLNDLHKW